MIYGCSSGTIVTVVVTNNSGTDLEYGSAATTCTICPNCGQSTSNHFITSSTSVTPPRFVEFVDRRHPILSTWRSRVIRRWRPYRRRVSYLRFLRPQSQAPRPKCRDPPVLCLSTVTESSSILENAKMKGAMNYRIGMREYREGERARIDGFQISCCPYKPRTSQWFDWRKGWIDTDFCV